MVRHIRMTCTPLCLHRFEKKCSDGFVCRIQAIDMLLYGRKTVLELCSPITIDYWTAKQRNLCIWIFGFYMFYKLDVTTYKFTTVE